jgi:hypothetical protein
MYYKSQVVPLKRVVMTTTIKQNVLRGNFNIDKCRQNMFGLLWSAGLPRVIVTVQKLCKARELAVYRWATDPTRGTESRL